MTIEIHIEEIKLETQDTASDSFESADKQEPACVSVSGCGDITTKPKGEYFDPFAKTILRGSVDDAIRAFLTGKLLEARWTSVDNGTVRE